MTIRRFINFFHENHFDAINLAKKNSVNIGDDIGSYFLQPPSFLSYIESQIESATLLGTKSKFIWKQLKKLSVREKQCLKWFLKGKPATQIAKHLHLSPRTIESHLGKIKEKLCCKNKEELFEQLVQFNDYLHFIIF